MMRPIARQSLLTAMVLAAGALMVPATSGRAAAAAAVERLKPGHDTIKTRLRHRTDLLIYTPPSAPVDAPAVIYFSGVWGWRPLMQDTASHFAARGRYVLGIESPGYFEKDLAPEEWSDEMHRLQAYINGRAGRPEAAPVALVGFDFGAAIIPWLMNRAGADWAVGAILISPAAIGARICRMQQQLRIPIPEEERFDVGDEMERLPALPIVLIEGSLDEKSAARTLFARLKSPRKYAPVVGGNHQFTEAREIYFDYVAQALDWLDRATGEAPAAGEPATAEEPSATGAGVPDRRDAAAEAGDRPDDR